jgi:ABC-type polar amino acid transport system ATPase subunit
MARRSPGRAHIPSGVSFDLVSNVALSMDRSEVLIRVNGLSKSFGDVVVLDGINLTVHSGERVCIIGPSGSGKSTLLRCLNFLEEPDSGMIFIAGTSPLSAVDEIGRRSLKRRAQIMHLRSSVGMVFQSFNLWRHMTVLQNVTEAPRRAKGVSRAEALARARDLLERVGLQDYPHAYPSQLSGGQQQRVAIARALAMEPRVMLFDEPTSSLDPELVGEVLSIMRSLANAGTTMLVVTHEMRFAADIADRIVFMDDGRIVEEAPPAEFFRQPRSPRAAEFLSKVLAPLVLGGSRP